MFILELAVQAVRGFSPLARVHLKSGYWCLVPGGGGPAPLQGVISALCYPDGRGGDVELLAPGQRGGRIGVTLLGADQVGYRLVRDLGGSGSLQRVNKANNQVEVITRDAAETVQFLRGHVGLPPKSTFEQLFCFRADQFPSRGPKQSKNPVPKEVPVPSLASAQVVEPARDVDEARARLQALENEARLSREVDELQFALDGVASQMFELESTLKSHDGLRAAVAQAEQAFETAPSSQSLGLSPDILERVERFPVATQRRDDALAKLDVEREQAAFNTGHSVPPLWHDVRFVGGVLLGVVLLGAGIMLSGYLRYLVLLDIPAFGFAALVALKYVEDLQASGQSSRREEFLAAREKKIHEDYEREAKVVKAAFAAARVESAEELSELLGKKALLRERLEELRRQLVEVESEAAFTQAHGRYQELKAEQERINGELLSRGGGYVRDLREVERELSRVKESIEKALQPPPARVRTATGEVEVFADPTPGLFGLGADLFAVDTAALGALIKDRAAQYLAALTDRRYLGVEFDKDGRAAVLLQGQKIAAGELPPADLDWLYLSVRLALVEKYSARARIPVVIEDALDGLDPMKIPLLGRMLKHLGTMTQVLHLTSAPLGGIADGAVNV